VIDEVWLSNEPTSIAELIATSCVSRPPSLTVAPATSGPLPAGAFFAYTATAHNNDLGVCPPESFFTSSSAPPGPDVFIADIASDSEPVPSGATQIMTVLALSTAEAEPGQYSLPFQVNAFRHGVVLDGTVGYEVVVPQGCV